MTQAKPATSPRLGMPINTNHVHAVGGQDVGDGATATGVNAAEFGGLAGAGTSR